MEHVRRRRDDGLDGQPQGLRATQRHGPAGGGRGERMGAGWTSETWANHGRNMGYRMIHHDTVGITIINHPFGNGLYLLSMVIWGMV